MCPHEKQWKMTFITEIIAWLYQQKKQISSVRWCHVFMAVSEETYPERWGDELGSQITQSWGTCSEVQSMQMDKHLVWEMIHLRLNGDSHWPWKRKTYLREEPSNLQKKKSLKKKNKLFFTWHLCSCWILACSFHYGAGRFCVYA